MANNFVVYKSSAGSGKTFTLVKEYLRLSMYDEKKLSSNYKRILAVTFTNKAAAEMKSRVITALNQIANHNTLPLIGEKLLEELKISEPALKTRASVVLSHILHHYSDFSIGTIDSFTHKIVKTFAHDLKLPVNFNIELDTENFYKRVIATLFSQVGEDDYVSRLLKEYALSRAQDNSAWDPEKQIQEFSRLLLKEDSGIYLERLKQFNSEELESFRLQFADFIQHYKTILKNTASKALELISENHLCDNDFTYKSSGPQSFFRKCFGNNVTLEDSRKKRLLEAVRENKWAAKDGNRAAVENISPELSVIANELIDFITEHFSYYSLCEVLGKQMYPLMLLKKIEEISLEQKQEERLVFISEFNHKIFDIIHNEPTPFIYERLGERYRHYLLDEFQDTSALQWHNILPLIDNSLGNGWFNLVVGDGKQSIYRWRNANVQQFSILPEINGQTGNTILGERAESLKRNYKGELLNRNFRSSKTIVEFNNQLFSKLSTTLLNEQSLKIYENQTQLAQNNLDEGYVSLQLGTTESDLLDEFNCLKTKDAILNAIHSGFDHKDIAILCRKNDHGNTIASYLVQENIPVVSSDSLLLKNNLEINTIICYLRYLVNRRDQISAATILQFLKHTHKIKELELHEALLDLSQGKSLFGILERHHINLKEGNISLNNVFDHCIEFITALNLTAGSYHYIRFFLDEINEFLVLKNSNISSFFDWWENRSRNASMIIPETTNAVKIMTIHASKGLEFPVVIVPYCNWPVYRAGTSWVNVTHEQVALPVSVVNLSKKIAESGFDKELETEEQEQTLDNLNLLYVAFTRAVDRLHILATNTNTQHKITVSDWINTYAVENLKARSHEFLEIGKTMQKSNTHNSSSLPAYDLLPLHFSQTKNTIRIKASYKQDNQEAEAAKLQGILIHSILSKITTAQDIEKAIEEAVLEGLMTSDEHVTLSTKLNHIVSHPELSDYYKEGIRFKIEAELITQAGELLRPDRIVFTDTETILIDYKTGKENNDRYSQQLYKYQSALNSMGFMKVKKLLVYIDKLKVVSLN